MVTKSLFQWKFASHAARTHVSRIHSAQSGLSHAHYDLSQAKPAQFGLSGYTAAGIDAVKANLRAISAQSGSIFIPGAAMQAFLKRKCGADIHVKKALFHHAAKFTFHHKSLLPHSDSLTCSDASLSARVGSYGMCTRALLAKSACPWSAKYTNRGLSCKAAVGTASQNKQRSLVALPHISLRRAFFTDSPTTKRPLSLIKQPMEGLTKAAGRYKQAASLQIEAFWRRNMMILGGAVGVLSCILLWRIMYGVANIFVSFSEGMAKFGFLAMAASTVAFTAIILKNRYSINPDKVYRIVMRMLNTSPKALEVLGAPLTGSDLRAYIMSGGGLRLKNFKPTFSHKRSFLMFPIQGSERKGLVSAEVKKKKGKYDFKLIAIDVAAPGPELQIFIVGDESEYKVGGGLMAQLRTPILKTMAAQKEFDAQDEKEAEEEERAEAASREQELKEAA